jgi:hypothetical protein
MTSPDGITWTSRSSAADNEWYSITYGNGLFVAISTDGTGNRVMTSTQLVTPTFTAVAPICSGASLAALPITSNNGITGTWSPALNNTATTTYTFTPTAGQCATTATLTITVNPNITPTFTAVAPICSGASLSALPITSNNGITGTWSPALNNTLTTTYTFTPTAGLCATTATLTITVNPNPVLSIAGSSSICAGVPVTLTASGANNYTWNGVFSATTVPLDLVSNARLAIGLRKVMPDPVFV